MSMKSTIGEVQHHVGERVIIGCWLQGKRSSGKIQFLQLRDGSGYIQAVVVKNVVGEEVWETASKLTHESSLYITGTVKEDTRSKGGYELDVEQVEIIQIAEEYPISR
ncbi:Asparagine--tRNA ligase [compost metagenome]